MTQVSGLKLLPTVSRFMQTGPLVTSRISTFSVRHSSRTIVIPTRQKSAWNSIIPKYFRGTDPDSQKGRVRYSRTEWNPATFFIVIFLVIGSNAIQMIALRNSDQSFSRKTEARIALLRELIEKLQRGETVDTKKILDTGDGALEEEWDAVMQELLSTDDTFLQGRREPTEENREFNNEDAKDMDETRKSKEAESSTVIAISNVHGNLENRFL